MSEDDIKDEMRLWAIEVALANLYVMVCALDPNPVSLFDQIQKQMIAGAKKRTFPEVGAAMSDLYSAELENAVTRLTDMVRAQMRIGLKPSQMPRSS
jgi:hypothetical protein